MVGRKSEETLCGAATQAPPQSLDNRRMRSVPRETDQYPWICILSLSGRSFSSLEMANKKSPTAYARRSTCICCLVAYFLFLAFGNSQWDDTMQTGHNDRSPQNSHMLEARPPRTSLIPHSGRGLHAAPTAVVARELSAVDVWRVVPVEWCTPIANNMVQSACRSSHTLYTNTITKCSSTCMEKYTNCYTTALSQAVFEKRKRGELPGPQHTHALFLSLIAHR